MKYLLLVSQVNTDSEHFSVCLAGGEDVLGSSG